MKALITGGLGFLGTNLALRLLDDCHQVVIMDNLISGSQDHYRLLKKRGAKVLLKDIVDDHSFDGLLQENIEYVFNLACPASPAFYTRYPLRTLMAGSVGVFNIIDFCEYTGAKLLHTSTSEIYGDPLMSPQPESYWGNVNPRGVRSVYDESKRFAEAALADALRRKKVDAKIVRIFNTFGPRMRHDDGRAVPNFIYQSLRNEPITIYGGGGQTRSLCYVDDTIDAILLVASRGDNEPYNIGNPEEISMNYLAELIKSLCKSKSDIVHKECAEDDPQVRKPDIRRIGSLGWKPRYTTTSGLALTVQWFKERYNESIGK